MYDFTIQVLTKEKEKLKKQLKAVIIKCERCPASELIELRSQALKKIKELSGQELLTYLELATKREKEINKAFDDIINNKDKRYWDKRALLKSRIRELESVLVRFSIRR